MMIEAASLALNVEAWTLWNEQWEGQCAFLNIVVPKVW